MKQNLEPRNRPAHKDKGPYSLRKEASRSLDERVQQLVAEMEACLAEKRPINLSIPPHREITEALHHLVYTKSDNPAELDIIYNDMAIEQKRPKFPVHSLSLPSTWPNWESDQVRRKLLNIGTLSFRHVAYDNYVDLYLLRDRETRAMNNLEIQEEAFRRMSDILDDPYLANESYISIYQTGLEPIVVGLYRAVVEHLKRRGAERPLFIRPIFYADGKKETVGIRWWARGNESDGKQ